MIHRFDLWKNLVDRKFEEHFGGLNSDDFEDWLWHDAFSDGLTPSQAFRDWLEEQNLNPAAPRPN